MDIISRQDAIDALGERPIIWSNDDEYSLGARNQYDTDKLAIETVPPAQPEIIRCRDCKFWREHKYAKETKRYIPFCGLNAIYTKSDDFCSKAERRTDESD